MKELDPEAVAASFERATRQAQQRLADMVKQYQRAGRTSKHPAGATKQTVAARKAKNRARRKANKRGKS
jgi:hypothetical protein